MKTSQFFLCFLVVLLSSCGKSTLPKMAIQFGFVQYTSPELTSIQFTRYQKGSNFSQVVDSILLIPGLTTTFLSGDTTTMWPIDASYRINDDYDIEIKNLFDNKSMRISNIHYSLIKYTRGIFSMDPPRGGSPVSSYVKDGIQITVTNPEQSANESVYLVK